MVTVEQIIYILPILGLTASITYYALVIRNQTKTRQVQLFMQIFQQINSEEGLKSWAEVVNLEVKDYEEFLQKYDSSVNPAHYAKRGKIWYSLNTIGELLRMGVIDIELLHRLAMAPMTIVMWEKWEHILKEMRKNENAPELYEGFEHLYNEISKLRKKKDYPDYSYPNASQQ